MLPNFQTLHGAPWRILPPGEHIATLQEIKQTLAFNPHRLNLFNGLSTAASLLAQSGCKYLYLDGSYVTEKDKPSDFDACWCIEQVNLDIVDPIFTDFSNGTSAQKARFGGELFPNCTEGASGKLFRDFFKNEKHTNQEKGIIVIDLQAEFSFIHQGV
ncbi:MULTISPECIES: DUF6932 family protein [Acinetobacter calcoaceticus/baumannii complex]|uniref:DUF6932 family protein n=1 Tax=Acinetobacter calcoaceticus TaxID=471 RepID=UPI0005DF4F7A|nr:hypothetical protein [Acinetobacter calcoaceticus]KJH62097.1 hypothetical protein UF12_09515 [Acinetobacter calcoaceticus]